jgi:hypothetical protein
LQGRNLREQSKVVLLIRPDGAQLCHNPASDFDNTEITGEVLSRQFLGSRYKVIVSCHDNQLSFDLPLDPPPPQIGEKIRLEVSSSALILLNTDEKEE